MRHAEAELLNVGGLVYNTTINQTKGKTMTTTTTKWALFPLTYKGIDFVSRIDTESSVYNQIMALADGVFVDMNKSMLDELTSITEESTYDEITDELERVNVGGSYAFIELA